MRRRRRAEAPARRPRFALGFLAAVFCISLGQAAAQSQDAAPPLGVLCGDSAVLGYRIEAIDDGGGCAVAAPVAVAEVAGVALSPLAVLHCDAALRLAEWVEAEAKPAARREVGAALTEITHYSAYVCKRRNSAAGGKLSLHATGLAIDLAVFQFENGAELSVLDNWRGRGSRFVRRLWSSACGPFTTVLGPESDAFHKTHLHLDLAPRRTPYCR